jgi:hypothetical protein
MRHNESVACVQSSLSPHSSHDISPSLNPVVDYGRYIIDIVIWPILVLVTASHFGGAVILKVILKAFHQLALVATGHRPLRGLNAPSKAQAGEASGGM